MCVDSHTDDRGTENEDACLSYHKIMVLCSCCFTSWLSGIASKLHICWFAGSTDAHQALCFHSIFIYGQMIDFRHEHVKQRLAEGALCVSACV